MYQDQATPSPIRLRQIEDHGSHEGKVRAEIFVITLERAVGCAAPPRYRHYSVAFAVIGPLCALFS